MRKPIAYPHVVFAGGGTGGHLFPGLAVAERLLAEVPLLRITFAGGGGPFERRQVAAAGFDYLPLRCQPLPRRLRSLLSFVARNLEGYRQAKRFLGAQPASAVVGLGGYGSVPMARAAVREGIPLVLLEQNAVPGRATRWLASSATLVCTAFEEARRSFSARCPVRLTGNPLRSGFTRWWPTNGKPAFQGRRSAQSAIAPNRSDSNNRIRLLLVVGGSNGARPLNQDVPRALSRVRASLAGWKIVHQSGYAEWKSTQQLYRKLGLNGAVVPFITDMPRVLARADLALCRAGGTTLAELAATGVPAILVPYPRAVDDHQRKNADVFSAAGACLTVDERDLPGGLDERLAGALSSLLDSAEKRAAISEAVRRLAHPDAAWDVATMVRQIALGVGRQAVGSWWWVA